MNDLKVKQLYEKVEGEYVPFNPQNNNECIPIGPFPIGCHTELISEKDIEFILSQYNFFNLEWKNDAENTRLQIPETLRKNGIWITYTYNGKRITERYIGTDMQAQVPETWKASRYWEVLDFDIMLRAAEEAIKNIFYNIDKYPKLLCLLRKWIKDWLDGNKDDIMEMIKEVLGDDLYDILKNLFLEFAYSPEFQEFVKNILGDMLDDLLAEYFEDIQRTLTDWERVIANALARHEMAITELQNKIN